VAKRHWTPHLVQPWSSTPFASLAQFLSQLSSLEAFPSSASSSRISLIPPHPFQGPPEPLENLSARVFGCFFRFLTPVPPQRQVSAPPPPFGVIHKPSSSAQTFFLPVSATRTIRAVPPPALSSSLLCLFSLPSFFFSITLPPPPFFGGPRLLQFAPDLFPRLLSFCSRPCRPFLFARAILGLLRLIPLGLRYHPLGAVERPLFMGPFSILFFPGLTGNGGRSRLKSDLASFPFRHFSGVVLG